MAKIQNIQQIDTINNTNVPIVEVSILEQEPPTKAKSLFELVEDHLKTLFVFQYNEVSNEVEIRKNNETDFNPVNENNLYRHLQHVRLKLSQSDLSALLRSDFVPTINPFKKYFASLKWTSNIDHIENLASYVKAINQVRFNYHFKKMLVRIVACALDKEIFNKQAFILVSYAQNPGKTTFLRNLCPADLSDYITEHFSPDKDGLLALTENLIINLDELASLSKYEINQLKSSFSKDKVKVRRPFDKKPSTAPRRASFVGSTNKTDFLTDETGSVRWLCFEMTEIDWNYSKEININDVWAQAYALYTSGFKYTLTAEDIKENDQVNRQFQKVTPEAELIAKKYEPGTALDDDKFLTPYDMSVTLNFENAGVYKFTPENVGRALVFLGFERSSKRLPASQYPTYGYYVKEKTQNTDNKPSTLTTNEQDPSDLLPF